MFRFSERIPSRFADDDYSTTPFLQRFSRAESSAYNRYLCIKVYIYIYYNNISDLARREKHLGPNEPYSLQWRTHACDFPVVVVFFFIFVLIFDFHASPTCSHTNDKRHHCSNIILVLAVVPTRRRHIKKNRFELNTAYIDYFNIEHLYWKKPGTRRRPQWALYTYYNSEPTLYTYICMLCRRL